MVLLVSLLGGSTCSHRYDDDDDDDSYCDDDDSFDDDDVSNCDDDDDDGWGYATAPTGPPRFELLDYRLEGSTEPDAHPVRRVLEIRGLSLFGILGPGEYGTAELKTVTRNVLDANPQLLGLPEEAGTLRFQSVQFGNRLIVVQYVQESPVVDGADAGVTFLFDQFGNLFQIENTTVVPAATRDP